MQSCNRQTYRLQSLNKSNTDKVIAVPNRAIGVSGEKFLKVWLRRTL